MLFERRLEREREADLHHFERPSSQEMSLPLVVIESTLGGANTEKRSKTCGKLKRMEEDAAIARWSGIVAFVMRIPTSLGRRSKRAG